MCLREISDKHSLFKWWHEWVKSGLFLAHIFILGLRKCWFLGKALYQANLEVDALISDSLPLRLNELDRRVVFELSPDSYTEGFGVAVIA